MIMNLELLKGKQYPYIIRFTEAGIQHITTNGTVMGVVNVPCTHDCDTGGIIGISDVDNDTFKLMLGMPIANNTIGGIPFTELNRDLLPMNLNKTLNLEAKPEATVHIDPKNLKLILRAIGDVESMKFEFAGDDLPLIVSGENWSVYIMGMG